MQSGVLLLLMGLCMLELILLLDLSDNAYVANVMLPLSKSNTCLMQFFVSSGRLLHVSDNRTLFFCNVLLCRCFEDPD